MKQGIGYAVLSYLAWGLLPLYWRLFQDMPAWEVLAHRIVWAFVFVAVLVTAAKRWKQLKQVVSGKRNLIAVGLSSLFISANWLVFIWAVNNDHVVETSLGYYMNPLISILMAVIFLKERLSAGQWIAIALAGAGVAVMAVEFGSLPWVSLVLAGSFALYGLAKKAVKVDALLGLTWETMIVLPLSLAYLLFLQTRGESTFTELPIVQMLFLLLAGPATALPLFWFGKAASLLPLSVVGFIQYISPTTSLLLAVFVFHEPFEASELVGFGFIWLALIVYSAASLMRSKPANRLTTG
ncbi:EamA family transporter RarD [Cohnella lubricantis]|uniref:EamA family transporter RarD n=1 Tax=Cohnella lubricantis TaxID=2163172 RepID=A0A841TBM5_9BACL|nr:EamA family transporter RarD [Cohnella lubricantis]MBB6676778.1 EamA family transporter RarD [Cohnella lubricantis]MBP2118134.1 chloramphenicol-sensitive protein RarD [Cohnella lubricantis]